MSTVHGHKMTSVGSRVLLGVMSFWRSVESSQDPRVRLLVVSLVTGIFLVAPMAWVLHNL